MNQKITQPSASYFLIHESTLSCDFSYTETHLRTTDADSFLCSLTPDGFSFIHRPRSSGIGGIGFFIHDSYKYRKVDTPNYSFFENIVISVSVSCRTLLLASIYCPPGPCSSIFLDEFMSFVFCLLLIAITSYVVISIYTLMYLVLMSQIESPFRII